MRKMIIHLEPNSIAKTMNSDFLNKVKGMELLEMIKLDFERGLKMVLVDLEMKPGLTPDDIKVPRGSKKQITILRQDGDHFICIISVTIPKAMKIIMSKFNLDVAWTTPCLYDGKKVVLSVLGDQNNLKKLLKATKFLGKVTDVSYQKGVYQEHNLLSVLTDKQREIIIAAKRGGYYEYPRRTDAGGLAESVGVSKATVIEHLRKAEGRLMANILAGY